MTAMSPEQIRRIAEAIAQQLTGPGGASAPPTPVHQRLDPGSPALGDGVFATVDDAVAAARQAFAALDRGVSLQHRFKIIAALRAALREHAEPLAREAEAETKLGRWEDKVLKNLLVTDRTPGPEELVPQAITGDHGLTLVEPAPFGVIGAITPCTNPTSTIICNAIGMLSAGNTVVFNVHPTAKRVSVTTVKLINRTIVAAGGPPNMVCCVAKPTIESANRLMTHPGIRLVVVTGGGAVVEAAMGSGKRAICGGPGNPPAVVDETADIDKAGRDIIFGHSFDNNVICVDEKECIAVGAIADDLKVAMQRHGAVLLKPQDLPRLEKAIFSKMAGPRGHATVNREFVGKNAELILTALGIPADRKAKAVLVEVDNDHPLVWTEQMMPVLPITRVANVDQAIDLALAAEGQCFHTVAMHSKNLSALSKMARLCNASIFVKNGPCVAGLGVGGEGWTSFTIASPTGEGLTSPKSFSRWRRCSVIDHFRIT
jgi:acyl-CoA reductase-like NAD-dependent aldehyde dehydrogenase